MIPRMLRTILSFLAGSVLVTGLFAQAPRPPRLSFPAASPAATVKQTRRLHRYRDQLFAPEHARPENLRQPAALR